MSYAAQRAFKEAFILLSSMWVVREALIEEGERVLEKALDKFSCVGWKQAGELHAIHGLRTRGQNLKHYFISAGTSIIPIASGDLNE